MRQWLDRDFDSETKARFWRYGTRIPLDSNAFYRNLEFGRGLRGKMGVGTNRINKYDRDGDQGLANYILSRVEGDDLSVCISYDSRNNSNCCPDCADVLSANGLRVRRRWRQ